MTKGIVLGNHISSHGIQVDPHKITIIKVLPTPSNHTDVRSFLGHVGYYQRFIENFNKVVASLFRLLHKDTNSCVLLIMNRLSIPSKKN